MELQKPLLKWVGGKTQIIDKITSFFPKELDNYYEFFLGGASVLFALLSLKKQNKIKINGDVYASDLNPVLIYFYKCIQEDPKLFIEYVETYTKEYNSISEVKGERKINKKEDALKSKESYYYWIRSLFNEIYKMDKEYILEKEQMYDFAAMFLFLNKTCFRGVYREGPNGFNVPFGHYKNVSVYEDSEIYSVSELIKDVVFECKSFREQFENKIFTKDDFIYLDPPYVQETDTSFVSYTKDGFGQNEHLFLFQKCRELKGKKIPFLLSNADVDLVRKELDGCSIMSIECKRSINSKDPSKKTNEVLII